MEYITDLHLHSKYSRAVSQDMEGARIIGIRIDRVFAFSFGISAVNELSALFVTVVFVTLTAPLTIKLQLAMPVKSVTL